tara:strand:+ start:362 stop:709 length:348 start_codon:yes stop_codon:yes gene_type:complete
VSTSKFSRFLEILELHENLLHAETQAIAAKHLDTIESLIETKEENLNLLLGVKEELNSNPRQNKQADELIEKILKLQDRNSKSFAKLYQNKNTEKMGRGRDQLSQDKRLKRAYLG